MIVGRNDAVAMADKIVCQCGTRNPERLAEDLGIIVIPRPFVKQKGAYKVIERNRFIFIKQDLSPVMYNIVLLHEIGHDMLHRQESIQAGGFQEFSLFDMNNRRMEYEANIFAAQVSLPDEDMMEYIYQGFDVDQIAIAMKSDINLVALKVAELSRQGYDFRQVKFQKNFLK